MSNLSEQISTLLNTAEIVEDESRFILLRYGGVDLNSALKRRNYGSIWNTGIRIWTNSVHSNTKTNKDLKRKRNSKRESQRRVMHQNFQLSN